MLSKLIVFVLFINGTYSARILGVMPVASYAHQASFHPLWRELSLRGHQVTLITTDPQKNASLTNLTELDMGFTYEIYNKYDITAFSSDESKSFLEIARLMRMVLMESQEAQLSSASVQNLIHSQDLHFDLLIGEAQLPFMLPFGWKFRCPIVGITSLDAAMQYHDAMGNPVHPVINPDKNLAVVDEENLTFRERLTSLIYTVVYKFIFYQRTFPKHHEQAKRYFGNDLPTFDVLQNNISMLLINTHPILHSIRPVNVNTVTIAGLHIEAPKPLPSDLKKYLDESKLGVIYFSLGTNVKVTSLSNKTRNEILQGLGAVPYDILMKFDGSLEDIPKNIKVKKWISQRDVLAHPNVKLFVTQGGLQSMQEALYNEIPVLAVPFIGDQYSNANRMVKYGYGFKLDKKTITKDTLSKAINEVMENPKYRERVKELGKIFKDQDVPSLQKAIYWIEYVIRHKGARHFRSTATGMPTWKYYMLDVLGFLFAVLTLAIVSLFVVIKFIVRLVAKFFKRSSYKEKQN